MKVSIPIYYKKDSTDYKRTIEFVNPNATETDLADFVTKLNSLTDNQLTQVLKVVEDFINRSESDIALSDILSILNSTYTTRSVDDGITESDILSVLNSEYTIQPVENGITQADIDNIFTWRI